MHKKPSKQVMTTLWMFSLIVGLSLFASSCHGEATTTCLANDATCQATTEASVDASGQTPPQKLVCEDKHDQCNYWAGIGECKKNPGYMNVECRRSCELCSDQKKTNSKLRFLELAQAADMGVAQELESEIYGVVSTQTAERIVQARAYMETVNVDPEIKRLCLNQQDLCFVWAVYGECEKNPQYMKKTCAPACHSCDYLSIEGRCPLDPNAPEAWAPGDLDAMFVRLTTEEPYTTDYDMTILSSPDNNDDEDGGPWVITLENVVSQEEANILIELGAVEGYERSHDVGKLRADGSFEQYINSGRTSSNSWCMKECYKNPTVQNVLQRLSNITGIPETNSEYLQLLRYERDQFYTIHHDYISHQNRRQQGVRILTLYLYLNDVEAGGGTNFDKLNITVMPKRGRALIWPSVLNSQPHQKDPRTTHQALPVEAGEKFGANAWFHMRDFKTPHKMSCSS